MGLKTLYDIQVKPSSNVFVKGFSLNIVLKLLYRNKKLFGDSSDPEIEHFN